MPLLSVVIPVYHAEKYMIELYQRLRSSIETISLDFEILFIEDGGKDRSWNIIEELSRKDSRVKGFQFSRNFGQHYGITAGLDNCRGEWVIVMDCDLQDRPEEIPRLYAKAQEGYDIVLAKRKERNDGLFKKFSSHIFYRILSYLSGFSYDEEVGNFRIISKKVAESLKSMRESLRFFPGLVSWLGFPTSNINVDHDRRFLGKSTYTFRKRLNLATEAIISYTDKPLKLSIKFGFSISFIAFLYGIYIFLRALIYHIPVPGWGSLMVSLYFLGGIIITILGIIGVYLGKTFDETKKRPLYVILNRTFDESKTS